MKILSKKKYNKLIEDFEKSQKKVEDLKRINESLGKKLEDKKTSCKMNNGKDNRDNLIEEMADVMICMDILKQVYGVSDREIQIYVCQKHSRCDERMNSDES